MSDINEFSGNYRFLSNFHPAAVSFDDQIYPSVEHAYQAAKTLDPEEREIIRNSTTPGMAKKLGKHVKLRSGWISEEVRERVMAELVWKKFSTHPDLAQKLLDTGDANLIEGNTWGDTYWGVCRGVGENMLGEILMQVRQHLRRMHEHGTIGKLYQKVSNG